MTRTKKWMIALFFICGLSAFLALGVTGFVGIVLDGAREIEAEKQAANEEQFPRAEQVNPPAVQPPEPGMEGVFPAGYTLPEQFYTDGNALIHIYNQAPYRCMSTLDPACRQENLLDGSFIEITRLPRGGWSIVRREPLPEGKVLRWLELTPDDQIDHILMNGRFFYFGGPDGTLNQLYVFDKPSITQVDVIRFDPSGAQTECECADGTTACCENEENNFLGKPNTYCAMFPSDPVFCASGRQGQIRIP